MVTIREALLTDLQDLLDLYALLYGKTEADEDPEIMAIWNRIMSDRYYHVLVAEMNGKIVSTCSCIIVQNLTYEQRPFAIIENLVTDSSYRARGLASALLEEAKRIARTENCYKIMLNTASKLDSTLRFYENLGFDKDEFKALVQWL